MNATLLLAKNDETGTETFGTGYKFYGLAMA